MKTIYTPEEISLMDKEETKRGIDVYNLVELAGAKIAETIQQCHSGRKALFFCGTGNNGADGIAAARLMTKKYICRVVVFGSEKKLSLSSMRHLEIAKKNGVQVYFANTDIEMHNATDSFDPDIVIDALLGTGASRFPEGLLEKAVMRINQFGISSKVIAIDVPTGLLPATGQVGNNWVSADITVTIQGLKPGLLMFPGAEYTGKIIVVKAFEPSYSPVTERFLFDTTDVLPMTRQRHSHKGSYGRLGIIAGSRGLSGAGTLCARAALRSGCGLLTIASPVSTALVYAGMLCEAMTVHLAEQDGGYGDCVDAIKAFLADKDACVVGPGMGNRGVFPIVSEALQSGKPLVLDADAINTIAAHDVNLLKDNHNIIVTPHPAELARLMNTTTEDILADPIAAVESFANTYSIICMLKMSTTIVAAPGQTAIITSGCAAMAKGGSGDVLAGCLGGLLAARKDLFYCACLAAFICGKAGEAAQQRLGATYTLPSDEIDSLSTVFMQFE